MSAFSGLVDSVRTLQDLVAGARPAPDQSRAAQYLVDQAVSLLAGVQVPEAAQLAGRHLEVDGRAQSLVPALHYDRIDDDHVAGRVICGRFYLGGGGAVHGGGLPLLFDEILGRLAGGGGRPRCRTAYLHVNYRKITPIGRELRFAGSITKIDGRKMFLGGTLHDGPDLLADVDGLFVALKPGQP